MTHQDGFAKAGPVGLLKSTEKSETHEEEVDVLYPSPDGQVANHSG